MNAGVQPEAPAPDVSQQQDAIAAMLAARTVAPPPAVADAESIAAGQPLGYATPGEDIAVLPSPRPKVASVTAALDEERGSALAGALRPGGSCSKTLSSLGVTAVSVDPIRSGSCGIAAPVEVAALGGGAVKLSMKAVVNCDVASTLGAFMRDVVDPLARQKLGGSVTDIRVAAAYHCRSRNGVSGAKLSEHAKGNAIDISAFKVKGEWIEVGGKNGLAAERLPPRGAKSRMRTLHHRARAGVRLLSQRPLPFRPRPARQIRARPLLPLGVRDLR